VGLGWLALEGAQEVVLAEAARFTLALILISVGLQLPRRYLREEWRSLTVLTLGGLALMWAASTLLLMAFLRLDLLTALLLGAVITPLDPVLAAGVTVGKVPEQELPARIRHLLGFESAASHGLGYLLVMLPVLLISHPAEAWTRWSANVLLWDGLAAIAMGLLIGALLGRVQRWSLKRGLTSMGALFTTFVALALGTMALLQLMGSSGLLAVLVAGIAYAAARTDEESEELKQERQHYELTFKQILQVPIFVLLGAALPWQAWGELGWAALGLIVAVLLLRRVPAVLLLKPVVPRLPRWDSALFIGWFGPIGVGALHFALLAREHAHVEQAWVVGSLLIVASTVVHDLTTAPFMRRLQRRLEG
jgi:NhaP-type Na+/H+ or K+/H+ antiporter